MVIQINKGDTLTIDKNDRELTLKAVDGVVWITRTSDPHDYVLTPQDKELKMEQGKLVIQALTDNVKIEVDKAG